MSPQLQVVSRPPTPTYSSLPAFLSSCFFSQHINHSASLSLPCLHCTFAHHDGTHLPNTTKCLEGLYTSHQPGPWSPRLACGWLEPVSVFGEQKVLIFLYSNLPISSFMDHAFGIIFKKLFSYSVSQCYMTKLFLGTYHTHIYSPRIWRPHRQRQYG